uniref:Putative smar21 n=1 Tax=Culex tarsalis TaxID=7177 RepID=A0A1Q3EU22_CULTA
MSTPPDNRRKLTVLTIEERLQIIELYECGWKVGQIANDCKVPQSTVSTVVKNKQKWLAKKELRHMRKTRVPFDVRLEKSMALFVQQARDNNLPLSGAIIREKAKEFADQFGLARFKASSGWLSRFVQRHHIALRRQQPAGEEVGPLDLYTVPELIRGYAPCDVFVASETGLYYGCMPEETGRFQQECCHGGEHSEERVTLLCATNMDGSEKLPLVVIGKSHESCFVDPKSLPVIYESNPRAWMTSGIFERWILSLDSKFEKEYRQVVMFVESSPVHPKSLQNKLNCINLQFLPTNATSELRLLNQIIKTLKYHYRFALVKQRLEEIEQEKESTEITLLDAINCLSRAWYTDLQPTTIASCFQKAGFIFPDEEPLIKDEMLEDGPATISDAEMAQLVGGGDGCCITFLDYCNVDDGLATSGLLTDSDIIECVAKPDEVVVVKMESVEETPEETAQVDADMQSVEEPKRTAQVGGAGWGNVVRSNLDAVRNILLATENVPREIYRNFFAVDKFLKEIYK